MDAPNPIKAISLMEESPPSPPPNWNVTAERILSFVRQNRLIIALEEDMWFYQGTAESQLAAFLRDIESEKKLPPP